MHTAVLTCVYPGVEEFVPEFIDSLSRQSRRDFTLLVLNDGVADCDRLFRDATFAVQTIAAEGTPAKIRKAGIEWTSRHGFEAVVFADSDDVFAENRIEESISLLEENAVVFNELVLFGAGMTGRESMYGGRFIKGEHVDVASIQTCNCLGLSNTAARVGKVFEAVGKTPDDTVAFDWSLFTRVLAAGETALYTSATCTYYRQHGANIAAPGAIADRDIRRGISVKARHYAAVSDLGTQYRELAVRFARLEAKVAADPDFAASYCLAVRAKSPVRPLWWETICTAEELSL